MNIPKVYVSEIFQSIQGEGVLSGYDTLFIRFAGCRVGCVWCDTKYSWKTKNSRTWLTSDLALLVQGTITPRRWLCITGGEPLEQMKSLLWLIEKLNKVDYKKISIETCGAISYSSRTNRASLPDIKDIIDLEMFGVFFSVSPKLESALGKRFDESELFKIVNFWENAVTTPYKLQFKFVVSTDEDLKILEKIFKNLVSKHVVAVMIEESKIKDSKFIDKCVKLIRGFDRVRLTVQQHKILRLK